MNSPLVTSIANGPCSRTLITRAMVIGGGWVVRKLTPVALLG
jgi:hypothetical protein